MARIALPAAAMAVRVTVLRGAMSFGSAAPAAAVAARADEGVRMFAFKCGSLQTQTQLILANTRAGTPMDIPVTFFVLQHGSEWMAFDTGNNVMAARDAVGYWGAGVVSAYRPVMSEADELQAERSGFGRRT